jgi:hypothetical protein
MFYLRGEFYSRVSKYAIQVAICAIIVCTQFGIARADSKMTKTNLWSAGITVGTEGVGGEISYLLHNNFAVRAKASYLGLDWESKGHDENFNLSGYFAGVLVDFHPFQTGWRTSGGLKYVNVEYNSVKAGAQSIGNTEYTADQIGSLKTSVRNSNPAVPYFGVGYDSSHYSKGGTEFNLGLDIGALYIGESDVKLITTKGSAIPGIASDLTNEAAKTKGDIPSFYPVIMLSGRVSF